MCDLIFEAVKVRPLFAAGVDRLLKLADNKDNNILSDRHIQSTGLSEDTAFCPCHHRVSAEAAS